jgi:hypothetical protein
LVQKRRKVNVGRQTVSDNVFRQIRSGDTVRIKEDWRVPLSGQAGTVISIDSGDSKGAYLVEFSNGLQFRYRREELTALQDELPGASVPGALIHAIRGWWKGETGVSGK